MGIILITVTDSCDIATGTTGVGRHPQGLRAIGFCKIISFQTETVYEITGTDRIHFPIRCFCFSFRQDTVIGRDLHQADFGQAVTIFCHCLAKRPVDCQTDCQTFQQQTHIGALRTLKLTIGNFHFREI